MANDSSFGGAENSNFDLDSQSGVTHLLASVRASTISTEQKNELRDLIFLYANGGKEQSVRITLEKKISTYGLLPLPLPVNKKVVAEKPKLDFGTSRPSPSFSSPTITAVPDSVPEPIAQVTPKPSQELVTPKAEEKVLPTVTPVSSVVSAQQTVASPASIQAPAVPQQPPQVQAAPTLTQPEPKPVAPMPVQTKVPVQPESVIQPTAQQSKAAESAVPVGQVAETYDPEVALQRIREIKSLVNDKVGNPVNLVDIDNEVGREYMGALLDAMKKLNSGSSAISAMKRLETAYLSVEKTLSDYEKKSKEEIVQEVASVSDQVQGQKAESTLAPTPAPAPTSTPVKSEAKTAASQPAQAEVPATTNNLETTSSVPTVPKSMVQSEPQPETESVSRFIPQAPVPPVPKPQNVEINKQSPQVTSRVFSQGNGVPSVPVQSHFPAAKSSETKEKSEDAWRESAPAPVSDKAEEDNLVESAWGSSTDTVKSVPKEDPNPNYASPLSSALVKPRNISDLPEASSLETSSQSGDPLFTKEVDNGLNQLLVEWVLFKKSGFFGTGPKGVEHPLFKKLAGLQIPLLLAGRFEGATQEIKQSITDYMNGWRYEQGIIYNQGETFEHYLRRVIRHILDLQK